MAAEPADNEIQVATVVLTAQMAFESRMTAIVDAFDAAAHGLDHCPENGRTRPSVSRASISVDVAGRVDLFLWVENSAGKIQMLAAGVPSRSAPFMVARQLAEQFVASELLEGVCPASSGGTAD
jgi:hypothetical protein